MKPVSVHQDRHRRKALRQLLLALGFLIPNILGFLVFTFLPVFASMGLSFVDWDLLTWPPKWVGLANYQQLLGVHFAAHRLMANDPRFWSCIYNTLFLMLGVPIGMAMSLFLAMLMNRRFRGVIFFRSIYFLPSICSAVAVCLLWRWLYNPDYGLINSALLHLGIKHPPGWLNDPSWSKPALMLMTFWAGIGGYNCVIYLAGLQGIPAELYEAADMDGANGWHRFRYVTWPLLAPTTFFIFTTSVISGFSGGFTAINLMTDGGPAGSTTTVLYYVYQNAFQWFRMGYAAALAWTLFVLVFGITVLNFRHYGKTAQEMVS